MDFSHFLELHEELSLTAVLVLVLIYDLFSTDKSANKHISTVACILFALHTLFCAFCLWAGGILDAACGINLAGGAGLGDGSLVREAFGGMYVVSPSAILLKNILNVGVLLVLLQSSHYLRQTQQSLKQGEFYFLMFSTLLGMYFMFSSGNFLLFFLGMETASIPMAALIAFNKYEHRSAEAGGKFILTTAFASGISFFGLSLIYGGCGSLYFSDITPALSQTPLIWAGMIFLCTGLFFKISLVPFHLWTADVYEGAPTPVAAYLSVISKGAGVFALFLVLNKVFAPLTDTWQTMMFVLIVLSITIGNLFALRQKNMKRFLAFSSISQAGYIVLGVISASPSGLGALLYYVFIYVLSNIAIFGVVHLIEQHTGKENMDDYNGLYKTNPKLSLVVTFAVFSLAGIPPFAGFFSKFFIFASTAESGFYVLLFIALINTIISLYYYLLVVKAMFINPNENPIPNLRSDNSSRVVLLVCTSGLILCGIISCIYTFMHHTALLGL